MINKNTKILGESPKTGFDPLFGELVVQFESISEANEVKIPTARLKLRDENGKIVRGQYTNVSNLEFVRFDVVLKVVEGEHSGRKIWTKLSTHPDYIWLLKGVLYATNNTSMTLEDIPSLVGQFVKVEVNTVPQTYTKKIVNPETAIEEEVEKTTQKTFVNRYSRA